MESNTNEPAFKLPYLMISRNTWQMQVSDTNSPTPAVQPAEISA